MKTKLFLFTLLSIALIGCQESEVKVKQEKVKEYIRKARDNTYTNKTVSKIYADSALKLSEAINYKEGIADAKNRYGSLSAESDSVAKSLKYYKDAMNISENIGYKEGIYFAECGIGNIFLFYKDYIRAEKYNLSCLNSKDTNIIVTGQCNLSEIYLELNKIDTTKKYLDKASCHAEKIPPNYGNKKNDGVKDLTLGLIDYEKGERDLAESRFYTAEIKFNKNDNKYSLAATNFYKAKIARERGDTAMIFIPLLDTALSLSKEIGNYYIILNSNRLLSEEYEKTDTIKAYKYLKEYVETQDRMNQRGMQTVFYEIDEITSKREEAEKRNNHNFYLGLIILGCCVLGFSIYRATKSKFIQIIEKLKEDYPSVLKIKNGLNIVLKFGILITIFEAIILILHPLIKSWTNNKIGLMLAIHVIIGTSIFLIHHKINSRIDK